MNANETLALYNAGVSKWNEWAEQLLELRATTVDIEADGSPARRAKHLEWMSVAEANFEGTEFANTVDFSEYIFPGKANFTRCTFSEDVLFQATQFGDEADFSHAVFRGDAVFRLINVNRSVSFKFAKILEEVTLEGCIFSQPIDFTCAEFRRHVDLTTCTMHPVNTYQQVKFHSGVNFSGRNLTRAKFHLCLMPNSIFRKSNLSDVGFSRASLKNCDFLGAQMDTDTSFGNSTVSGSKIDRYALECMNDKGGLTKGALMTLDVHDDVATLRRSYSGVPRWLHLIATLAFLFPYIWFFAARWTEAKFGGGITETSLPLWKAFTRYVFNGGVNWEAHYDFHHTFIAFVLALILNGLRAVLLWKTKSLEFDQEITGWPAIFSLDDKFFGRVRWRHLYNVSW